MATAVRFEAVTKRYPGGGPRYAMLRDDLSGRLRRLGRRLTGRVAEPGGPPALDRVSFEVEEGDSFAIIGPNGAGKTTVLKLVSRISYPTSGRLRIRGRVAALIEVGSGVHPELTARENIWLYGQILGLGRGDIRRRFDRIVEFAELGHVLDAPVKTYSAGMQLRLGFAIAAHLDPEIFVVDEALAVGDAGFQAKCVERMSELVREGRTLFLVSHDLPAVEATCRSGLLLLDGRVAAAGPVRQVVRAYLDWVDDRRRDRIADQIVFKSSRYLTLERVTCHGPDGEEQYAFKTGDDVEVRLRFRAAEPLRRPYVSLGISDGKAGSLVLCSMLVDGNPPPAIEGTVTVSCWLHALPLLPRVYQLWCSVRSEQAFGDLLDWQTVGAFRVTDARAPDAPTVWSHLALDGPVHVAHEWQVRPGP